MLLLLLLPLLSLWLLLMLLLLPVIVAGLRPCGQLDSNGAVADISCCCCVSVCTLPHLPSPGPHACLCPLRALLFYAFYVYVACCIAKYWKQVRSTLHKAFNCCHLKSFHRPKCPQQQQQQHQQPQQQQQQQLYVPNANGTQIRVKLAAALDGGRRGREKRVGKTVQNMQEQW